MIAVSPLHRTRFGLEIEAYEGPEEFPLGQRGTDHGGAIWEYRTQPITLQDWLAARNEMQKFFERIEVNPRGDPPTGLHIHVEVPPDIQGNKVLLQHFLARLARLWEAIEKPLITHYQSTERQHYAAEWSEESKQEIAEAIRTGGVPSNRYLSLNYRAYPEHGTVEFRIWDGTGSFQAVEERIALCLSLVWRAAIGCGQKTKDIPVSMEVQQVVKLGQSLLGLLQKQEIPSKPKRRLKL